MFCKKKSKRDESKFTHLIMPTEEHTKIGKKIKSTQDFKLSEIYTNAKNFQMLQSAPKLGKTNP